ncbi:lipopolysaccharide-induced tumor necrosis factor-alpha factor homolog isoform X1 [Portunus trituberculatus]|uniref:lipopolysaccharide-induced tumor necrosis factor-alpha factor homolog isoform X1 n=1 Tax=Portunus trituberculatus TaxID=210409 RepID=UPI001E1CC447|nr:lipopolysaccharide-induced tumor necrosis factor-alpha factor homolog isoform X1 [Portunus trituberculatus]
MSTNKGAFAPSAPPPYAPPSYSQAVGGVPPQAPFTPLQGRNTAGVSHVTVHLGSGPYVFAPRYLQSQESAGAPTTVVTTVVPLGSQSTHMICPHCRAEVDTTTKTSPSVVAWLSGFIICILGCWMGCCLIPCCLNDCMDVEHSCPHCNSFLGKYKRG